MRMCDNDLRFMVHADPLITITIVIDNLKIDYRFVKKKLKMFIIVETIEDGEVNLCVVPESWEKNGILFWPPGRKGLNLRKDDSILPDFNNWSKQKCTVKRKNFTTFQAAIRAEKYLSQFNDTEDEEK